MVDKSKPHLVFTESRWWVRTATAYTFYLLLYDGATPKETLEAWAEANNLYWREHE